MYDSNKTKKTRSSLGDRIGGTAGAPPKVSLSMAEKALKEATGEKGLTIKGASAKGNVVDVTGLADGTTSEDVEVCRVYDATMLDIRCLKGCLGHLQTMRTHHQTRTQEQEAGSRASDIQE